MKLMQKTMNFIYYRPVLRKNKKAVLLDAYFDKVNTDKDKCNANIDVLLKNIQLHEIKHHKEYQLSSGSVCKSPLWELRFIHKRIDVPGIVDEKTNTITALDISNDQKIADTTVLLYDPTTDVVIINKTQSGVSHEKISRFINHFVENEDDRIELSVMTDSAIIDKVQKQAEFTAISARLINVPDLGLASQFDDLTTASLKSVIEVYNRSNTAQEFAATIDYSLSINARNKKAHLSRPDTLDFVKDIIKLLKKGLVKKCWVKARNEKGATVEKYDLLKYIIKDDYKFDISDNNRYISPVQISQAMVEKYNADKRNIFLNAR